MGRASSSLPPCHALNASLNSYMGTDSRGRPEGVSGARPPVCALLRVHPGCGTAWAAAGYFAGLQPGTAQDGVWRDGASGRPMGGQTRHPAKP